MKPTEEEVKKFWKWCGLRYEQPYWLNEDCPEGTCAFYGEYYQELLRTITLDNLFKWAVPKVKYIHGVGRAIRVKLVSSWGDTSEECGVEIVEMGKRLSLEFDENPALALFWAIYKTAGLEA